MVEDHGATVDNLVARYNRVDKAYRDAFAYPADSPGSALYRAELLEAAEAGLLDTVEDVTGLLDRITPVLGRAVELLTTQETTITEAEFERATARKAFVEEDCDRLPLPALRDAIAGALRREDRSGLFLYLRYAPARLDKGSPAEPGPVASSMPSDADNTARDEIRSLLDAAKVKLTVETSYPRHKMAVAVRIKALDLQGRIAGYQLDRDTEKAIESGELVRWGE